MKADFKVVLDACVLANYGLCDLFLRLAEAPRLYLPKWTTMILDETQRVQKTRLVPRWSEEISNKWRTAVETAFPEAMVDGFEKFIPVVANDAKDRHVLAAAIAGEAEVIVTFNLRDFPAAALDPWEVYANHPSDYLIALYGIDPGVVVSKIEAIARKRKQLPWEVLGHLAKSVPGFAEHVAQSVGWELDEP